MFDILIFIMLNLQKINIMKKTLFLIFASSLLISSCGKEAPKAEVRFKDGTLLTVQDWSANHYYTGDTIHLKKEDGSSKWEITGRRKSDTTYRCYKLTSNGDTIGFNLQLKTGIVVATSKNN